MPNPAISLLTGFAHGEETTWGTAVAPDRFIEIESESIEEKKEVQQDSSLRSGSIHTPKGSRRTIVARWGDGGFDLKVAKNGMGRLVNHALGGTSTIAQQGATTAYLQTHQLGSTLGKGLTIQKQLRDEANAVVQQFTMSGTKVLGCEWKIDKKGDFMMSLTVDSKNFETTTAVATPVYPSTSLYHFAQATLKVDGVAASLVSAASVKLDRKLDIDRFHFGSAGRKQEQIVNDRPAIGGTLACEFADPSAFYTKFAADTAHALILEFTGSVISGIYSEVFRITLPEVRFGGEVPKVNGAGLVMLNAPFDVQWDGTNADIKIEIVSTDTSIL